VADGVEEATIFREQFRDHSGRIGQLDALRIGADFPPMAPNTYWLQTEAPAEALDEPLRAFPSWFLRIVCDRCGKERMIAETHMVHGEMLIRDIIAKMRHDGCGGRAGRMELLTGIEGVNSRPVRKIIVLDG
jgi:hypothetical protein